MLAFSFPEETDSPWQLRPKMFAYFCSNKFFSALERIYTANMQCGLAVCTTNCLSIYLYCISKENSNQYGFPMHTQA